MKEEIGYVGLCSVAYKNGTFDLNVILPISGNHTALAFS